MLFFLDDLPTKCISGKWTDKGSYDALVDFFSWTSSSWSAALESFSRTQNIPLILPSESDSTCFLGAGGSGRVFKACVTSSGEIVGIKFALSLVGCLAIKAEVYCMEKYKEALKLVQNYVVQVLSSYFAPDQEYASVVVTPVGKPLPKQKYAIKEAIIAIKRFSQAGLSHGDARYKNVIWIEDSRMARLIDFQTLSEVELQDRGDSFVKDLIIFAKSLNVVFDSSLASSYFESDCKLEILLQEFFFVWGGQKKENKTEECTEET